MGHVRLDLLPDPQLGHRLLGLLAEEHIRARLLTPPLPRLPPADARGPALLVLVTAPERAETLQALRRLRADCRLPCLVLGPRQSPDAVAEMLDCGADDVLDSGQPLRVGLARVRAVLRRAQWGAAQTAEAAPVPWRLVLARRQLLRPCGTDAELTTGEYDLFRLLSEARGQTICRDRVAEHVLRRRIDPTDRSVDNLVMRLRRKLGEPRSVKTVRGLGYMFAGFDSGPLQVT